MSKNNLLIKKMQKMQRKKKCKILTSYLDLHDIETNFQLRMLEIALEISIKMKNAQTSHL